jgi:hypothetical protein
MGTRGVAVLGPAGKGKSTLAAVLRRRNHLHLSDGMCILEDTTGQPHLIPGPPSAKLWPDTLQALGADPRRFEPAFPNHEKRLVPITSPASPSTPASIVFVLDVDPEAEVTTVHRLPPVDSIWELVQNYYLADYFGRSQATAIFSRCARLAKFVQVFRLVRPNNLHALDEVADAVERTVASCP